ncbi:MAG: 50S ribosomal protein L4 [Chthoniobacteraceae bacterium]
MATTILTIDAAKAANIEIVQEEDKYNQAVHDVVVALHAGRRSGSANTKTRGEVSGSNAKPWRQKGTGRARAGEKRSPIWRGGGVVFGPKPRDYSKKVNRKVTKVALRKAFSERVLNGDVLMIDGFSVPEGKTKEFIAVLDKVSTERKTLVLAVGFDEPTLRSARNVRGPRLKRAIDANTEDLLRFKKILITDDALAQLAKRMALSK